MRCLNCNRIIIKKLAKGKAVFLSKRCPWCKQHIAPRQSLRSPKETKK